jgi:hypothetical protein
MMATKNKALGYILENLMLSNRRSEGILSLDNVIERKKL